MWPRAVITITAGNLKNNHIYLSGCMELFPNDVIGGSDRARAAPRTVQVRWGSEVVDTDIDGSKCIFRRRGWVRRFFAETRIADGEKVLLEQEGEYAYRVSRAA